MVIPIGISISTMGCGSSSWNQVHNEQLKGLLTERQVQIVKDTWDIISDDLEGTGIIIFRRLFQSERDLKNLFTSLATRPGSSLQDPRSNTPGFGADELELDETLIKKHAKVVMETLGAAVECIEDSVFLTRVLVALGEIHGIYRVRPQYLSRMWPAIRAGFQTVLQDVFTEEVEQTWKIVFNYIISKMRQGMKGKRTRIGKNGSIVEASSAALSQIPDDT